MYGPEEIHDYVVKVLETADSGHLQVNDELLTAEVTVEHPPLFFGPPRLEKVLLNLVFRPEAVGRYPGAELVVPGSFRLDWFIDGMRRRGKLALQCVHCEMNLRRWQKEIQRLMPVDFPYFFFHHPSLSYRPFLLADIGVAFRTDERADELCSIGVDLVSGEVWPDLLEALKGQTPSPRLPSSGLQKEGITPAEAIGVCRRYVEAMVQERDKTWAYDAETRFDAELSCLKRFYAEEEKNGDYERRAHELYEKFRPRIVLSWVNIALLYLPEIGYTLQSLDGSLLPKIVYYPVGGRLVLDETELQ